MVCQSQVIESLLVLIELSLSPTKSAANFESFAPKKGSNPMSAQTINILANCYMQA